MFGQYKNIKICGIAATAPKRVVNNLELVDQLESRRAKRQVSVTGINRRHVCQKGQAASDMACVAAERVFEHLGWRRDEIKALIFVTQSPDVQTPATAMIVQKRLQIGKDCIAFDVNLGCTGYVSGLQIISAILNNVHGKGLLLVGDGRYSGDDIKVTSTDALLFGDGASATALEYVEGEEGFCYSQYTDGSRHELITKSLEGEINMDGNAVLLFSLDEVSRSIVDIKKHFSISEEAIDYYVLHQAQKIILNGMANECNFDVSKMLISYDEFGNTSTATVPLTICRNAELLRKKDKVSLLMSGFGVGLAWSNVYLTLDTKGILPLELSDFCYGEIE
ncbi:MAG: ketoacyl-ACP synthase III [Lachnospiraceae bacterium]|nr:ketoacyl-ACP synthase III [Lachnospiraceae bacterium]